MKQIVVIDDSATVRTSIALTLKKSGYTVVHAENGYNGLDVINSIEKEGGRLDLCIVDVNMPEMDGITFIKKFRTFDRETPVIVLTTESEDKKMDEGRLSGASAWLIKPFKPSELVNTVEKFL